MFYQGLKIADIKIADETFYIAPLPELQSETFAKRYFSKSSLICPISASGSNFNPRNIPYIPVVEIIAFLELEQKLPFFKGLRISVFDSLILCIVYLGKLPATG